MSSWYSGILTSTTSRITNLQRQVFASEADGDTEDDTHVCRVLRQYYTENGRALPSWLPPDPKASVPPSAAQQPYSGVGSRYGAGTQGGQTGLSSLWDSNRTAGRGGGPTAAALGGANARNPFARTATAPDPIVGRDAAQDRPLPSPRFGSYQENTSSDSSTTVSAGGPAAGGAVSSAQDRLKQRLWGSGARTTSPASSTGPFAPPPPPKNSNTGRSRVASSASSGGDYDPYGPGGQYETSGGGGGGASAGSGGGSGTSGRYGGLPSGPRRMGGLPSGPKMR